MRKLRLQILFALALSNLACTASALAATSDDGRLIERGRYLVSIAGCNDCHTPGYMFSNGQIPETEWLKGSSFGWHGPWGTTYPSNLRLFVKDMSEAQWIEEAKTLKRRPPMPWYDLNDMKDDDLRAIYRFIKSLGEPGNPAPAFIPPDREPPMPFASFPPPPG